MAMSTATLKQWFKRSWMFRSGFYRYIASPLGQRVRYEARRRSGAAKIELALLDDLRPVAAQRGYALHRFPAVVQRRPPSHTIAEDMTDLLRHSRQRIMGRQESTLDLRRIRARGEMVYSHLYAATRYPIHETFTCEIPDAVIASPTGAVITPEREVLRQSTFDPLDGVKMPILTALPGEHQRLQGSYVSLLAHTWTTNFGHWFTDALVRLAMLDPIRDDYKLLVPYGTQDFHLDALRLLGYRDDRVVAFEQRQSLLRVERLIFCSAAQRGNMPNAAYLTAIRDRLVQAATGYVHHAAPTKRIYISRAKASRQVVNEAALAPILADFGFETVCAEDYTTAEKIRLFSEANVVVGGHGAGMLNTLFCNPGATVVELYNPRHWMHDTGRVITLLGHEHWHMFGTNAGGTWDTHVDPQQFRKLLHYALSPSTEYDGVYDNPY